MIWRSSFHSRIAQLGDFTTAFVSFVFAYFVSSSLHKLLPLYFPSEMQIKFFHVAVILFLSWVYVFLFSAQSAYSYQRFTSIVREYYIVLRVSFFGSLITLVVLFLFGFQDISRTTYVVFVFINLSLLMIEKSFLFFLASFLRQRGKNRKRAVLIGTGSRAKNFIQVAQKNFNWGLDIIGLLSGNHENIGKEIFGIKVLDNYENIESVLKTFNPEEIIVTISTRQFDQIRNVLEICEREGVVVRLNSDFFGRITKNVTIDNVYGLNIISFNMVKQPELELFLKRLIDLAGSLVAITFFSPFMLVAALGIWIADGRPILYKWNVVGLNKKPFKSWKFRTMVKNADSLKSDLQHKNEMEGPVFKIKDDPRIMKFGKWLRKWSIDETPQLFSVLKGDMSLVGPRPTFPNELTRYQSWQRRKLSIKPGITCLWQINGRNQINKFDDWVRLDLEYIDNWSLLLDIKILLKTIPVVILGRGAS